VGYTSDLKKRIKSQNEGKNTATKSYRPFKLSGFVGVETKEKAISLEKYFKTGSGIAWMRKRLLSEKAD
jgi:predicted GIY-YIG superfamily endonuclease